MTLQFDGRLPRWEPGPAASCFAACARQHREEWWRGWRSELWHVRQACTQTAISWKGEREVAAFCLGAFQDALCLRREVGLKKIPLATTKGSAAQCMLFLVAMVAVSYGAALLRPGVRAELLSSRYRVPHNLTMIQNARYSQESVPTISAEQVRLWKGRKQRIFDGFAFYQILQQPVSTPSHTQAALKIARASSNLLELIALPVRFASIADEAHDDMPKLILSNALWKKEFGEDPLVSGRVVQVGLRNAVVQRSCFRRFLEASRKSGRLAVGARYRRCFAWRRIRRGASDTIGGARTVERALAFVRANPRRHARRFSLCFSRREDAEIVGSLPLRSRSRFPCFARYNVAPAGRVPVEFAKALVVDETAPLDLS